ncbi:MAG: BrnT family toxin [Burkholderiaceae bacterium]|nr:MAG: BrnT family toxin [Burkholderiaceae bacterium]
MDRYIEWNDRKAEINYRKHGIRFEEAALVFDDPLAMSHQDRIEGGERRWQTFGMVGGVLLLLVAHTIGETDDGIEVVRIISARRATRQEKRRYEHG